MWAVEEEKRCAGSERASPATLQLQVTGWHGTLGESGSHGTRYRMPEPGRAWRSMNSGLGVTITPLAACSCFGRGSLRSRSVCGRPCTSPPGSVGALLPSPDAVQSCPKDKKARATPDAKTLPSFWPPPHRRQKLHQPVSWRVRTRGGETASTGYSCSSSGADDREAPAPNDRQGFIPRSPATHGHARRPPARVARAETSD